MQRPKYQKYILILCLWAAACSVYFFWDVFRVPGSMRYVHTMVPSPAHAQQGQPPPISALGRAALKHNDGVGNQVQNESQHGRLPLSKIVEVNESALPVTTKSAQVTHQNPNTSPPVKAVTPAKTNVTSTAKPLAETNTSSLAGFPAKENGKSGISSANVTSSPSTSHYPSSPAPVSPRNTSSNSPSSSSSSSSSSSNTPATSASSSSSNGGGTSIDPRTAKVLCVSFTGRLGNELFEFASTLGLALTSNRIAVFQGSTILKNVLKDFRESTADLSSADMQSRCQTARGIGEDSCCKYKEQMTQLDPKYDYRVGMYLQSYRYFEKHQAAIRKAVTFNDNIRNQADAIVKEVRQKFSKSTLVGMHIRHGDMASEHNQKLGYPVAGSDYINRSVEYFSALYPGCTFVVASDSLDWVQETFPRNLTHVHFLGRNNDPAVDMSVLASMDHVVTSFGSFSWWIGFLNGGRTVYMKNFIRANTFIGNTFNPGGKDYVFPGWIPL